MGFTIAEARSYTKIVLALLPISALNHIAQAITDPSLTTIGRAAATLSTGALLLIWLSATKPIMEAAKRWQEEQP